MSIKLGMNIQALLNIRTKIDESGYTGWTEYGADNFKLAKRNVLFDIDQYLSPAQTVQSLTGDEMFVTLDKKLVNEIVDFTDRYIDQD